MTRQYAVDRVFPLMKTGRATILCPACTNGLLCYEPTANNVPTAAVPGDAIAVTTDLPITNMALIRWSAVSDGTHTDSRRLPLVLVPSNTSSVVFFDKAVLPASPAVCLPRHVLFARHGRKRGAQCGDPPVDWRLGRDDAQATQLVTWFGRLVTGWLSPVWVVDAAAEVVIESNDCLWIDI
jgi:hypothetical protein